MGLRVGDTVTVFYPPDDEVPYASTIHGPVVEVVAVNLLIVEPVWFMSDNGMVPYDGIKQIMVRVTPSGIQPIDTRDLSGLVALLRMAGGL